MSTKELHSYRLTSLEEPSDEMLYAIMEQVAVSIKSSCCLTASIINRQFEAIKAK